MARSLVKASLAHWASSLEQRSAVGDKKRKEQSAVGDKQKKVEAKHESDTDSDASLYEVEDLVYEVEDLVEHRSAHGKDYYTYEVGISMQTARFLQIPRTATTTIGRWRELWFKIHAQPRNV